MSDVTVIGRGANVVGRITGTVDLVIHGRVEGDVSVDGEVTLEAEGLIAANVAGRRVVIRGAVKGDVTGEEAVRLEEGARVVGDIRAPRVAITRGALIRGHVETHAAAAPRPRGEAKTSRAAQPSSASGGSAARAAVAPAAPAPPRKAPPPASAPALVAASLPKPATAAAKRPPPPVVPVLRKGTKGSLKKKVG
jgi:cytoskeletal protein CcmA (bactofilin family)